MFLILRGALGALLVMLACGWTLAAQAAAPARGAADLLALGRVLYLEGRRADGSALVATRAGGLVVSGAEAACVNCHRRSGMGGAEGRSYIPPVTRAALASAMPAGKGPSAIGDGRPAYTQQALAHALRSGVDPAGRSLDFLMPRYRLDEREVAALQAYLATLPRAAPQQAGAVHFATVIAPEVPRERADAMLGVLQACVDEHNAGPPPEQGRRKLADGMRQAAGRPWQLHVWRLQGPQQRWDAQLARLARQQPVLAMVGGIGGAQWAPVHGFCERAGVPCLFPHLEAPVAASGGIYPVYLGKGTLLEAALVARQLAPRSNQTPVVQVLRAGDAAAEAAAAALREALAEQGIAVRELRLAPGAPLSPESWPDLQPRDALVLWLRPPDLRRLDAVAAVASLVFVSATLAQQDEVALPDAWKAQALMAYPYELPQRRARAVGAMRQWLRARGVPPGDERVQADAYVACQALRTSMREAQEHLGPDYLLERLEANMERSTATGLYPRLALGIGQRFASKTGYVVRLDDASRALLPVGERSAP
jgi:mono/diheme cytochrome c family protein